MKQFYITINGIVPLIIFPDSENGNIPHPSSVKSYRIYHNCYSDTQVVYARTLKDYYGSEHYLGSINYIIPGRLLEYLSDGAYRLSAFEIQEVVNLIDDYRDTPALWEEEPMKSLVWYLDESNYIQTQIKELINKHEQSDYNFIETRMLVKAITSLRMEYNLVQDELAKHYPCLV